MALATVMAAILALTCSIILGSNTAYATVAKPKVTVVAKDNGQVSVSVKKIKKAKKYQYKITKDKKLKKKAFSKTTAKKSITVKTLMPGKTYYVTVRACDATGKWGKWSKAKKVKVAKPEQNATIEDDYFSGNQGNNQGGNQGDNQGNNQGGDQGNKEESNVHTHDYKQGGSYDFYEQERAKSASEALRYARLMQQYQVTHSSLNGSFNISVYRQYESQQQFYVQQAAYYRDLRDAEYYCSICGEKKPANSTLTSARV